MGGLVDQNSFGRSVPLTKAEDPKLKIANERSKAKDPKRKIPAEKPKDRSPTKNLMAGSLAKILNKFFSNCILFCSKWVSYFSFMVSFRATIFKTH